MLQVGSEFHKKFTDLEKFLLKCATGGMFPSLKFEMTRGGGEEAAVAAAGAALGAGTLAPAQPCSRWAAHAARAAPGLGETNKVLLSALSAVFPTPRLVAQEGLHWPQDICLHTESLTFSFYHLGSGDSAFPNSASLQPAPSAEIKY